MANLHSKVALVTGASSGIGEGICRAFVQQGFIVVGVARREDRLRNLEIEFNESREGRFHGIKCDLSKEEEILALFTRLKHEFKTLDICVSNAGISKAGSILSGNTESWSEMLQLNVISTAIILRESASLMRQSGTDSGHVIIIGSNLGHKVPPAPIMHFYSATKFAVRALADGLRQELMAEKSKIRVTHISPGPVRTEASQALFPGTPNITDILFAHFRPLESADVAAAAIYSVLAPANVNINEIVLNPIEGEVIPRPKEFS